MPLQLDSEEPEGGPWRAVPLTVVVEGLLRLGGGRAASGRGVVLAVDGRSSSGKTTLAARLEDAFLSTGPLNLSWRRRSPGSGRRQEQGLSPFSHGLTGRYRTMASMPDTWQDSDLPIRIPAYWPDVFH